MGAELKQVFLAPLAIIYFYYLMIRIEKSDWIPNSFARIASFTDVLTAPETEFASLPKSELDKIRNTQALAGDIVRVLGHFHDFNLIMKNDGSKGWVLRSTLNEDTSIREFAYPPSPKMQ